ncbi:hypothetical protein FOL47_009821 [Perkinsus chesapeaki]|uniref:Uncharacterized protein n=1 Tax=Perkinsus chesapeaki TaxID=330153 RepID=A0A7J6MS29_PERCH|nr:hypothetical protein FOL47_009821 [Perkinsus chesapeaki]
MFFGRSLPAFESTVYENAQGGQEVARLSGSTPGEAVLNRFIMLLIEHLATGHPMPKGFKILPKWRLTDQDLQPYVIKDTGYNRHQASEQEYQRANGGWRVSRSLPGLHHSMRCPLELGGCYGSMSRVYR